jgi:hypothetical protein
MPLYRINEGDLEVPGGWEDRTVTALSFPSKAAKPEASFAITRDNHVASDKTLASYVDQQLVDMAKTCPRFELIARSRIEIDATPAEQLQFTWRSPDGTTVQQQQTVILMADHVALTFTATAPRAKFGEYAPVFASLVETFRLRREAAGEGNVGG